MSQGILKSQNQTKDAPHPKNDDPEAKKHTSWIWDDVVLLCFVGMLVEGGYFKLHCFFPVTKMELFQGNFEDVLKILYGRADTPLKTIT